MNADDRDQFDTMKQDIRFIKDTLIVALENHLAHIERYSDETREHAEETRDMTEQAWGMARDAENASKRTEKFVVVGIAFMGLLIAIIKCVGG